MIDVVPATLRELIAPVVPKSPAKLPFPVTAKSLKESTVELNIPFPSTLKSFPSFPERTLLNVAVPVTVIIVS